MGIISLRIKTTIFKYLWAVEAINGIGNLTKKCVNYIPEIQSNVIISGWLFDVKEDNNIRELSIEIAGKGYHAICGLIRTDVSFEFKEKKYGNSGFRCVIPKGEFQVGRVYDITFRIRTGQEKTKTIKTAISFAIDCEKAEMSSSTSHEQLQYSQYLGEVLSLQYIAGTGIEIGALHAPLSFDNKKAKVLYVDRISQQDLYRQYPEFKKYDIVAPDIIDSGDELATISDNSYDFCISNHVLEHLEDPLKALCNWMRILKTQGILYLSIPLPYNVVDKNRVPTPISHIIDDFGLMTEDREEYLKLRHGHFLEFARSTNLGESANDDFLNDKARGLIAMDYSIHFHVFSENTLLRMVDFVAKINPLKIVEFVKNEPEEFIIIIEKQ